MKGIRFIDSEEARALLPYGCSPKEYLESCSNGAKRAWEAFRAGKDYQPSTYEYGTNAGDYVSPLVSKNGKLWYYRVIQERPTKCALIAEMVV